MLTRCTTAVRAQCALMLAVLSCAGRSSSCQKTIRMWCVHAALLELVLANAHWFLAVVQADGRRGAGKAIEKNEGLKRYRCVRILLCVL